MAEDENKTESAEKKTVANAAGETPVKKRRGRPAKARKSDEQTLPLPTMESVSVPERHGESASISARRPVVPETPSVSPVSSFSPATAPEREAHLNSTAVSAPATPAAASTGTSTGASPVFLPTSYYHSQPQPAAPAATTFLSSAVRPQEGNGNGQQEGMRPHMMSNGGRRGGRFGNGGRRESFLRRSNKPAVPMAGQNPEAYTNPAASIGPNVPVAPMMPVSASVSVPMGPAVVGQSGTVSFPSGQPIGFGKGRNNQRNGGNNQRSGEISRGHGSTRISINPRDLEIVSETDKQRLALGAEAKTIELSKLQQQSQEELSALAASLGVECTEGISHHDLLLDVVRAYAADPMNVVKITGVLELSPDGYGVLRSRHNNYCESEEDIFLSSWQVHRLNLRTGDEVRAIVRQPRENELFLALLKAESINGDEPEVKKHVVPYEQLQPTYPDSCFHLEHEGTEDNLERMLDLVAPLGKGQRGLILASPGSGKSTILSRIAQAIVANGEDNVDVTLLLVDERPEEVTEMKRNLPSSVEVIASTFEDSADHHIHMAELVLEKAKRKMEHGRHQVILLDSASTLGRAYNSQISPHGAPNRPQVGSLDCEALLKIKRYLAAARNLEGAGSLMLIATLWEGTASHQDELLCEELKGTGNWEIRLDGKRAERGEFPALDLSCCHVRREDKMISEEILKKIYEIRKKCATVSALQEMLNSYPTNQALLEALSVVPFA